MIWINPYIFGQSPFKYMFDIMHYTVDEPIGLLFSGTTVRANNLTIIGVTTGYVTGLDRYFFDVISFYSANIDIPDKYIFPSGAFTHYSSTGYQTIIGTNPVGISLIYTGTWMYDIMRQYTVDQTITTLPSGFASGFAILTTGTVVASGGFT